jgi:hypothetical protein
MMKRTIAALLFALALTTALPVASADVDLPSCYPCEDTK